MYVVKRSRESVKSLRHLQLMIIDDDGLKYFNIYAVALSMKRLHAFFFCT